jgi:tRNA-2-methylthio-N6-dimethylallyladenosine synthase
MNVADSDRFASILDDLGFIRAVSCESSNLVIMNTCVVRAKAEDKAISYLGEMERIRKKTKALRVIVAGCMASLADEKLLMKRFPSILFIVTPDEVDKFREMIVSHLDSIPVTQTAAESEDADDGIDEELKELVSFPYHSFVNVMKGCEQHCTYCIVPRTRGKNVSRKPDEIMREISRKIDQGAKAITLLGQSIMDYGKDWETGRSISSIQGDARFCELLDRISLEFPDTWIKFLTSHPRDCTRQTIDLIASRNNISKFLHLPVQAGDNKILKMMGRGHTREYYLELVDYIYSKIPGVRLSSDIIVGFPSEGESEFENSMDLLRRIRFYKLFTFLYSTRPQTPAEKLPDLISDEEKKARLNRLIDLQNQITLERHVEMCGSEIEIMVEGRAVNSPDKMMGRSISEDIVLFDGPGNINPGDIIRVRITEGKLRTLKGIVPES